MTDLTPEQMAPELIGVGAQAIQDNAKRLGLTWSLRPATVRSYDGISGKASVVFDGDTIPLDVISLVGAVLPNQRVMGMTVPPAGNFIIGGLEPFAPSATIVYGQSPVTTTVSGVFVNMGTVSPVRFNYVKNSNNTDVLVSAHIQFFASVGGTQGLFALTDGTRIVEISRLMVNVANTHIQASGVSRLTGMTAGLHTMNIQWARLAGAGTLSATADDTISIALQEIYPI